jgi:nitrogen fixation/metabolism regulation signal transduction histidine kinase
MVYLFVSGGKKDTKQYAETINVFIEQQRDFFSEAVNSDFQSIKSNSDLTNWQLSQNAAIDYFIFDRDSLVLYTSNQIDFNLPPSLFEDSISILRFNNGWYLLQRKDFESRRIFGLSLIKSNFKYPNELLVNSFAIDHIPEELQLSETAIENSLPILSSNGQALAYVYFENMDGSKAFGLSSFASILILLLVAMYFIWIGFSWLSKRTSPMNSFILLGVILLFIRGFMLSLNILSDFSHLKLFDPTFYASSFFASSLGELLISLLFLLYWLVFGLRNRVLLDISTYKISLATLFLSFSVIFFSNGILWIFGSLILDSVISLELYNVLSLSVSSIVALISIMIVILLHFLALRSAVWFVFKHSRIRLFLFLSLIFFVGFYFFNKKTDLEDFLFLGVWLTVYFFISFYSFAKREKIFKWRYVSAHIVLYALISMFLVENLYENKERAQRKFFASKLIADKDYISDFNFREIYEEIRNDAVIKDAFINGNVESRELSDRLSLLYFKKFFSNYGFDVFLYDSNRVLLSASDSFPERIASHRFNARNSKVLIRIEDSIIPLGYLGFISFDTDSKKLGTLALLFKPKLFYAKNLYLELLSQNQSAFSILADYYDYSVYNDGKLLMQKGDFPYPYYWAEKDWVDNEQGFFETKEWEHYILSAIEPDNHVVVSVKQEGFFKPMATFSYFFILLSFLLSFYWVGLRVFERKKSNDTRVSFKTKLQLALMTVVAFAFVVIGWVTVSFIEQQYETYYTERFSKKVKSILTGLEYVVQSPSASLDNKADNLKIEASKLSEINNIDINLYDISGKLMLSTRPEIFQQGLISRIINPVAYHKLLFDRENQLILKEHIGKFSFSSCYIPLRNKERAVLGYLHIPYLQKSQDIQKEVSAFLITILNVYAFLLLCAGIVSFFIANSITRPLQFISEKLKELNLQQINKPIHWSSNDEIGKLIGEYNKMIVQLERSAKQLAKTERESAWREMARQIAHEIKNPLTPMKLSIQYLQRAIDINDPNVGDLAKKVNRTLIEQIDNLSAIATAFSSFAQMPKPSMEQIDINRMLSDIVALFEKESGCKFSFIAANENPIISVDRNQLISVFNNLIKNAIQSTDEREDGKVEVKVFSINGVVKIQVTDNGKGIPEDQFEKVFVPNFTTKTSGTGLGLAISKQIIENLNGDINFKSVFGNGTTFSVSLPIGTNA